MHTSTGPQLSEPTPRPKARPLSKAKRAAKASPEVPTCDNCVKPLKICVCDLLRPARTRHAVMLLQHPQEDDHLLGTAALVRQGLERTTVRVGLSWASLAQALQREEVNLTRWALVFPGGDKKATALKAKSKGKKKAARPGRPEVPTEAAPSGPAPALPAVEWHDRRGLRLIKTPRLEGIILLDGTWKQAKTLLWRNPWLTKLTRLSLNTETASIYGKLRREPRPGHRSTLEATVAALDALGEAEANLQPLLRALRTLAQRLRDADRRSAAPKRRPAVAKNTQETAGTAAASTATASPGADTTEPARA